MWRQHQRTTGDPASRGGAPGRRNLDTCLPKVQQRRCHVEVSNVFSVEQAHVVYLWGVLFFSQSQGVLQQCMLQALPTASHLRNILLWVFVVSMRGGVALMLAALSLAATHLLTTHVLSVGKAIRSTTARGMQQASTKAQTSQGDVGISMQCSGLSVPLSIHATTV